MNETMGSSEIIWKGVTYRVGDKVIGTGKIIDGDGADVTGVKGEIVRIYSKGDQCGPLRVRFENMEQQWWMMPGVNVVSYVPPAGLILRPKRKMSL